MEQRITVLIADDHPVFQRGMCQIVESDPGFEIVAVAGDGEEALRQIRHFKPQVAVIDVDMPRKDGLEVMKAISHETLPVNVVFLTMYKEERFLNAALEAGVHGYVLKDGAVSEITDAIRAVANGDSFISPALSTILIKRLNKVAAPQKSGFDELTASEKRVLKLVSESRSNKQIADELFISVRTVENHRSNICSKLGLEGKNALLTYALVNKSTI